MQIADNVLAVLGELKFDGNNAVITAQLDRKLYLAVDEVLRACGGQWNRKAKAHVFPIEAAELVGRALASGTIVTAQEMGFFATPEPLAVDLCDMADVDARHTVLEPSAGSGRIIDALVDRHAHVIAVELDTERNQRIAQFYKPWAYVTVLPPMDFLDYEPEDPFDRVVMNPPFGKVGKGDHLDHVSHAFGMLETGGVLVSVLPAGVTFREDKRHKAFRKMLTEANDGSITMLPENAFRASGTDVRTCVLKVTKS